MHKAAFLTIAALIAGTHKSVNTDAGKAGSIVGDEIAVFLKAIFSSS